MKTIKVLLILTVVAALLWLFAGCGARMTRIVRPDGKEVKCEIYNVTSEGAIDCGNAADRQQLIAFCTASMEHAKLKMCATVGADRAPSDDPNAGTRRSTGDVTKPKVAPAKATKPKATSNNTAKPRRGVGKTTYFANKEFMPGSGVYWYNNR